MEAARREALRSNTTELWRREDLLLAQLKKEMGRLENALNRTEDHMGTARGGGQRREKGATERRSDGASRAELARPRAKGDS